MKSKTLQELLNETVERYGENWMNREDISFLRHKEIDSISHGITRDLEFTAIHNKYGVLYKSELHSDGQWAEIEENIPEIELPVTENWKYLAKDSNGCIHVFEEKPTFEDYEWVFAPGRTEYCLISNVLNIDIQEDCKNSLRKIKHIKL